MEQHYVPRGYLKAWCAPKTPKEQEPYVWVFGKKGGDGKRKAPKSIFYETGMYDFKNEETGKEFSYEELFQPIEDGFCKVREKIEQSDRLSPTDRLDLFLFVAAMHVRTPDEREHLKKFHGELKEHTDWILENHEAATPEQIEKYKKSEDYKWIRDNAENPHKRLLPMQLKVEFENYLKCQMNFTLYYTRESPGFITSDSPWVAIDPQAYKRPFPHNGPGLIYPTTEVRLPISPRFYLVLHHRELPTYFDVEEKAVDEFNRITRAYSREWFVVQQNIKKRIWFDPGTPPPDAHLYKKVTFPPLTKKPIEPKIDPPLKN